MKHEGGGGTIADEALDATVLDPLTADAPLARGAALGRYIVLELLGAGGMGVVYAAYDPELDRKVAVKLLRGEGGDGSSGRARLLREAQAMARLADPNVIHVYDVGTIDEQVFVAMELVDGDTLRRWARDRSPDEILLTYLQAGRGLMAAHAAGLIHRDFKPDNVLVGSDGRARVLDFGLARVAQEPPAGEARRSASPTALTTPLTRTGAFLGTPAYMAPEQLDGDSVDASCDQFAFCVSLYEALYGERPFGGDDIERLLENIRAGRVRPETRALAPSLRRALLGGLQAAPAARHPSMAALLEALRPRERRRVWRWAGAALLSLAALAGGARLLSARPTCGGAAERLAAVWSPPRATAAHAAFAATQVPFAESSWLSVARTLDAYGTAWVKQRTDACEATQVRGDQSAQTLDLRMDCYDRRLRELQAFTDTLLVADGDTVTHAVAALDGLPQLADCADVAALNAVQPLPRDAAARARLQALRSDDARAVVLLETGKHEAARQLARATAEAVRPLNYPPLLAGALFTLGRSEHSLGKYSDAKTHLLEAAWAADAGHDDQLKVRVWSRLCLSVGYNQHKPEEGHQYARNAEAALQRLGGNDPLLEADVRSDESQSFLIERKLPEALAELQRALALIERSHHTDNILWGQVLQGRGYVLGELGRDEESLADYQRARTFFAARLGPDHPQITNLLADIATYHFHKREFDRALDISREIVARLERQVPVNEAALAVVLNNIASALWELGRHDETLPYYRRVVALREKVFGRDDRKLVDPLTGVGDALVGMRRPAEAVAPLERALAIGEREKLAADDLGEARFALAQALWRSGGDRVRARQLALQSRAGLVLLGDKQELALLDAWLKKPN